MLKHTVNQLSSWYEYYYFKYDIYADVCRTVNTFVRPSLTSFLHIQPVNVWSRLYKSFYDPSSSLGQMKPVLIYYSHRKFKENPPTNVFRMQSLLW